MSTEKKSPRRPIAETNLDVLDYQMHQKIATDVIGVSFDAHWYEISGIDMESP